MYFNESRQNMLYKYKEKGIGVYFLSFCAFYLVILHLKCNFALLTIVDSRRMIKLTSRLIVFKQLEVFPPIIFYVLKYLCFKFFH